jgi:Centromere-binding protein ParB C-terminal
MGMMEGVVMSDAMSARSPEGSGVPTPSGEQSAVPRHVRRVKLSYYVDEDVAARARAAYERTRGLETPGTFGEFQEAVVLAEIERMEHKYNDGLPWDGVPPGAIKSLTQMSVAARHRKH